MAANEVTAHCQQAVTSPTPRPHDPRVADLFETADRLIGHGRPTDSRTAIFYESETLFAGTATILIIHTF